MSLIALAIAVALFAPARAADNSGKGAHALPFKYDYHFGENPWLPSQAQSAEGFIPAEAFPKAEWCAKCHADVHAQWRESAHANSFREPFYTKNVQILIDTKGIEYTRHCEGCHNPIALFSGALTKGAKVDRKFDADGISCMVCHSIQKIQNTSGTGSYVMGYPAVMVNEDGTPVRHKVDYDDILAHPELHKRAVMKDFYRTPEFCATCHKAALPKIINDYKWQRAFSVYDEWQQSSWSKQSPLPFYSKDTVSNCQDCHMKRVAVNDFSAPTHEAASHRWLAANTAIPTFFGYKDQLAETMKFLQDGLLGIDIFALEKNGPSGRATIAPVGTEPFTLAAGDELTVSVIIQNKKIGHTLVPEQRDFYESWVQFKVRDAEGKEICESGYLNPNGYLDERAHSYTNRLISKDGKLLDRHQVWMTRAKAYDNTIGPGASDLVRYQFQIPADVRGPITVTATVRYRRFRRAFTDYVLGKSVDYPIAQLGSRSVTWNVGENAAEQNPGTAQEQLLRWNNYGIALYLQQQYAAAAEAFRHVLQIQPDYAAGWINLGVANFSYEKYEPASAALNRALELAPGNARALFYAAMIDRVYGRLDAAAEKFIRVTAAYPRLRQAHQELGFTYYQQKKYALARAQYEAVQAIDPDDLSAHYNLMLIYRRLGMKQEAAVQAAYFADRKDDPGATAYAQDFLRAHNEISSESVPWHIHTDLMPGNAASPKKHAPGNTGN